MLGQLAFALILAAVVPIPPAPTQYVTDTAGVLSGPTIQRLDGELATYHAETGHRILVWIGQTTGDDPLEYWTIRAAERWKPGNKQRDDGAILFVFMRDHKIRIEVGYGLESALTDADSSRIIRETIAPQMRAGDVDGAITGGIDRMLLTITPSFAAAHQTTPQPRYQPGPVALFVAFFVPSLFLIVWVGIFAFALTHQSRRGTWYGGSDRGGWSGGGGGGGFSGGDGGSFGGGGASGSW